MSPFFFGTAARRLFGLYTPARAGGATPRAAVLCQPWGSEYLRAHRSMRQLATMLAAAGVHVLRFDYFGTGDSAGDMAEADLEGWRGDVAQAIDELRDTSGAAKVGLVGLRLGAGLAASVAARDPQGVDRLVLWDPVASGEEYLHELSRLSPDGSPEASPGKPDGTPREVDGFTLSARMAAELRGVHLAALAPQLPARTLVVLSEASKPDDTVAALCAGNPRLRLDTMESPAVWHSGGGLGARGMPVKLLQRIVEWHS